MRTSGITWSSFPWESYESNVLIEKERAELPVLEHRLTAKGSVQRNTRACSGV